MLEASRMAMAAEIASRLVDEVPSSGSDLPPPIRHLFDPNASPTRITAEQLNIIIAAVIT
jgi:hypothetical protein